MLRAIAAVVCASMLVGCGLVLDASPPRDRDAGLDASGLDASRPDALALEDAPSGSDVIDEEVDAVAPHPCEGLLDGDECSRGGPSRLICLSGECVPSFCGDGFVDVPIGEQCEPSLDSNCDPSACRRECATDGDCEIPSDCVNVSCTSGSCEYTAIADRTPCGTGTGAGMCRGGACLPMGCGDGYVDTDLGEECDTRSGVPGCVACRFECHEDMDCDDGDPCTGAEKCIEVIDGLGTLAGQRCQRGEPRLCEPELPCHLAFCTTGPMGEAVCDEILDDADGDGFSAGADCGVFSHDCDDADPTRNPGAVEACNGIDDDCDGVEDDETVDVDWCLDGDVDGFGDPSTLVTSCAPPEPVGWVRDCGDCWDMTDPRRRAEAALVHPRQARFFTTPYCPGDDATCTFDYDCDEVDEQELPREIECGVLAPLLCGTSSGWARDVPGCGVEGRFATCRPLLLVGCVGSAAARTQGCH